MSDATEPRAYFRREVIDGHILAVTIDRPEARNAFNREMANQFEQIVDAFEDDRELWVMVIDGAGTTFCAGQDLKAAARGEYASAKKRGGFGVFNKPPMKPMIAAVEGHAHAGGFELALTCDLIVATTATDFALTEVRRGLVAIGGGCMRLPTRIPYHAAMKMILTGQPEPASLMQHYGLLADVVEPGGARAAAIALAKVIAAASPIAVSASKEVVMRRASEAWTEEAGWKLQRGPLGRIQGTHDMREGMIAFAEKRDPVWTNG
jgi:enoyl-CoA hydratase